jgi:hypothetical protein
VDIYGALNLTDSDYAYVNTLGQQVIYDATLAVLGDHNADLAAAEAVFIQGTTFDHVMKYKLPQSGMLQKQTSKVRTGFKKPGPGWDVGFPLDEWGTEIGWDRVQMAYTSLQQYNLTLEGVKRQDRNTRRRQMLAALFPSASYVYKDENWPDITVQPLANGDAVTYPPIIGSLADTTANNYLVSGYIGSAISDTSNPFPTIVNQLEQFFGTPTGGSNIAVFINNAETPYVQALTNFDPIGNRFVKYGANVSLVDETKFPAGLPGRVIGESDSALIVEWRWIPAGYMVAIHLDAPAPLMRRIDPPAVGLGDGLQLIVEDMDEPIRSSGWSHRFGYGVANRLNAVIMQLAAPGAYAAPAAYAAY